MHASQRKDEEYFSEVQWGLQSQQQELEPSLPELAAELLPALQDSTGYQHLETLASHYAEEAELLAELQQADSESAKVKAQIEVREEQLSDLTGQIDTASEEETVTQIEELETALDVLQDELNDANREIGATKRDCALREGLTRQLDESRSEEWAYQTIEEAIYPGTADQAGRPTLCPDHAEVDGEHWPRGQPNPGPARMAPGNRLQREKRLLHRGSNPECRSQVQPIQWRRTFCHCHRRSAGYRTRNPRCGNIRCLFIDEGFGATRSNDTAQADHQ